MAKWYKRVRAKIQASPNAARVARGLVYAGTGLGAAFGGALGSAGGGTAGTALGAALIRPDRRKTFVKRGLGVAAIGTGASIGLGLASGAGAGASGISSISSIFGIGSAGAAKAQTFGVRAQQGVEPLSTGGQVAVPGEKTDLERFGGFLGRSPGKIANFLSGRTTPADKSMMAGTAGGSWFGGNADGDNQNMKLLLLVAGGLAVVLFAMKGRKAA